MMDGRWLLLTVWAVLFAGAFLLLRAGLRAARGYWRHSVSSVENDLMAAALARSEASGLPVTIARRMPRSAWGKVWKWGFILWCGYCAAEVLYVLSLARPSGMPLANAIASGLIANRLFEIAVLWAAVGGVLAFAVYATRGASYVETVVAQPARNPADVWQK